TIDTFLNNQEELTKYWSGQINSAQTNITKLPTQAVQKFNEGVEEIARQNLNLFETAMKIFSPFVPTTQSDKKEKVETLRQQIRAIQNRINELEKMSGQ
ncbi:MAG: hypothetical protein JWM96_969, partial [Alphaproteobacteria bacterium]|nr:hypothetical protein [Alphaproteobacteria bacterium]